MRVARPILPAVGRIALDLAAEDEVLDPLLDFVVELVAVVAEKFDAVVLVGIVRGAEHDAGIGAQRAGDVGDAGRGQRADEQHVRAERHDAGGERIFQHVAGKPRVLADDDRGASRSRVRACDAHLLRRRARPRGRASARSPR